MSDQTPPNHPPALREIGELAATSARDNLLEAFEAQGLTTEALSAIGHDLLYATKQKVQWEKGEEGGPGGFRYSKHLADNTIRFNTLKLLLEFFDAMPSKRIDIEDKRQTRKLANALFAKIEQAGMLGAEDKKEAITIAPAEVELMGEMIRQRQPVHASLNPMDMEDEDEVL